MAFVFKHTYRMTQLLTPVRRECNVMSTLRTLCTEMTIHTQKQYRLPCYSKLQLRTVSTSHGRRSTIDPNEVRNFEQLASEMWSEQGEYEILHLMNKIRVPYIRDGVRPSPGSTPLSGKKILDVGCGGGILSEPLARLGAHVTGIDASSSSIQVASHHASADPNLASRLTYLTCDVMDMDPDTKFDVVVASEVIEHVSDVDLFLDGCCRLVKSNGSLFLTTISRTRLSYLLTITMAENVLRIVPRGMHDWNKFLTPEELKTKLSQRGFATTSIDGMMYNPLSKSWSWQNDTSVNYALHATNMDMNFTDDT